MKINYVIYILAILSVVMVVTSCGCITTRNAAMVCVHNVYCDNDTYTVICDVANPHTEYVEDCAVTFYSYNNCPIKHNTFTLRPGMMQTIDMVYSTNDPLATQPAYVKVVINDKYTYTFTTESDYYNK